MNQWFYSKEEKQIGPVSLDALIEEVQHIELKEKTLIWKSGMNDWQPLESVSEVYTLYEKNEPVKDDPDILIEPGSTSNSPYAAPKVEVSALPNVYDEFVVLATRGSRLGASILDGIILLVIIFILGFAFALLGLIDSSVFWQIDDIENTMSDFIMTCVFIILYFMVNIFLLINRGQTVGKLLVGIQIVDYKTNQIPSFVRTGLLRYGIFTLVSNFIGLLGLIDVLFIFNSEKRCLHDMVAGTKVIEKAKRAIS